MEPTLPASQLPAAPAEEPHAAAPAFTSAFDNIEPSAFDNVEPEEDEVHEQVRSLEAVKVTLESVSLGPAGGLPVDTSRPDEAKRAEATRPASVHEGGDGLWVSVADAGDAQATTPTEAPAATANAGAYTAPSMKDLFGPFFQADDVPERAADPALVDTRSMLHTHFGVFVQEADVLLLNESETLAQEMRANKEAREQARVEQLFGEAGPSVLRREKQEQFTILHSTVPAPPTEILAQDAGEVDSSRGTPLDSASGAETNLWLVEMPKMLPNRQTLHADPQPFFPGHCDLLESDDRALYTPQNVLRWTHHKPSDTYMSNTRVVRWSDGSYTLHVGSDTYSLDNTKSNAAAHILGSQTAITKGNVTLPSVTKTLNPDKHFVIESAEARSIERAVLAESAQHQTKTQRMKLAYAQAPLPEVDWTKPNAARNPEEEYVAMEYERRSKELQKRFKEGRPMTLREQLEEDAQLFQQLNSANVEELLERQREERRRAAIDAVRRGQLGTEGRRAGGRSRLDRDVGLAAFAGMGSTDPFLGQNGSDDEREDQERVETGEESSEDDFEAMMERKRKRDEHDGTAQDRAAYERLIDALNYALDTIPMQNEDERGEVEGMVTYMKSPDFSPSVLQSEIPSLAKSISARVPAADMSRVWQAFSALP